MGTMMTENQEEPRQFKFHENQVLKYKSTLDFTQPMLQPAEVHLQGTSILPIDFPLNTNKL